VFKIIKIDFISIKKSFLKKLVEYAIDTYPVESCALFIGTINNAKADVDEIVFSENIDSSQISFSIDPEFLYQVYINAEKRNKSITGIFHSHPTVSEPSLVDIKFMKHNPVAWVILGILDINNVKLEDIRAFQYWNNSVKEVKIVTIYD